MRQRKQMGNEQLDSKKSDREMLSGEEVRAPGESGVAEGGAQRPFIFSPPSSGHILLPPRAQNSL